MTLSDYEIRVLQQIETELRRPKHPRLARAAAALGTHWLAIVLAVLAGGMIVALALVAPPSAIAAPLAAVCAAAAGYAACASRRRADRWNH